MFKYLSDTVFSGELCCSVAPFVAFKSFNNQLGSTTDPIWYILFNNIDTSFHLPLDTVIKLRLILSPLRSSSVGRRRHYLKFYVCGRATKKVLEQIFLEIFFENFFSYFIILFIKLLFTYFNTNFNIQTKKEWTKKCWSYIWFYLVTYIFVIFV